MADREDRQATEPDAASIGKTATGKGLVRDIACPIQSNGDVCN